MNWADESTTRFFSSMTLTLFFIFRVFYFIFYFSCFTPNFAGFPHIRGVVVPCAQRTSVSLPTGLNRRFSGSTRKKLGRSSLSVGAHLVFGFICVCFLVLVDP